MKEGAPRHTTMAVHEDSEIADTQIRVRGVEKQRGETVPRGFLQVALRTRAHRSRKRKAAAANSRTGLRARRIR